MCKVYSRDEIIERLVSKYNDIKHDCLYYDIDLVSDLMVLVFSYNDKGAERDKGLSVASNSILNTMIRLGIVECLESGDDSDKYTLNNPDDNNKYLANILKMISY